MRWSRILLVLAGFLLLLPIYVLVGPRIGRSVVRIDPHFAQAFYPPFFFFNERYTSGAVLGLETRKAIDIAQSTRWVDWQECSTRERNRYRFKTVRCAIYKRDPIVKIRLILAKGSVTEIFIFTDKPMDI